MYPIEKRRAFLLPLFLSKKSRSRTKKKQKKAPLSLSLSLSLSLFLSLFLNFCVPKKRALSLSLFLASLCSFTGRHDSSFCLTFLRGGVKKVLSLRPFLWSPPSRSFLFLSFLLPTFSRKKVVRERGRNALRRLSRGTARATLESKSEKEETI